MKKNLIVLVMSGYCMACLAQSQTRTAALFNWNKNPYQNLWAQEGSQYLAADDNSYAYSKSLSAGQSFLSLTLQDFRFHIPAGATIKSITVTARRFKKGTASVKDYFATLVKAGSSLQTPSAYGVRWKDARNYADAETRITYSESGTGNNGGMNNQTFKWTPAIINDAGFGVRIDSYAPVGGSAIVYYDLITITVVYAEGVGAPPAAKKSQ